MANIGLFHLGHTNQQITLVDGEPLPDASLGDLYEDQKQIIKNQIEHGILAEDLGFDRVSFLEHHFPAAANEFSPNPLLSQMSVASQTEEIQLLQMANILSWHDPIRLAEQTAMLDIVSGGRVEVGIGRGYQPKENEVLGQYWGGTVQDQEKNRASFKEKFEILQKAWVEDIFSYDGEFHQIPPSYTKWHHSGEYEYFESDLVEEYDGEDLINWKEMDIGEVKDNPVIEGDSTLEALFVSPKPEQKPHPQVWEPVSSPRSIKFAARNGINGFLTSGTNDVVARILDLYMKEVEESGWPDHRPEFDGDPFNYGWDERRKRGIVPLRLIFNTEVANQDAVERFRLGLEHMYNFYGSFGINTAALDIDSGPANFTPDADLLLEEGIAYLGDSEEIIDNVLEFMQTCGYDDFVMDVGFDMPGITGDEIADQMKVFADKVIPHIEEEYPSPE